MVDTILRRKRFDVTLREMLQNWLLSCCCSRRFHCLLKDSTFNRHKLIAKAEHMLSHKLDVLQVLKSTQLSKILLSAVLSPEQRLLLLYQRKQVVEIRQEDTSATSSSEDDQTNLTKNF